MQDHNRKLCENLMDYLTGDMENGERSAFEKHLSVCPSCRQELGELKEVWVAMPLQNEEIQVPDDLRDQVMRGIFGEEKESVVFALPAEAERGLHPKLARNKKLYLAVAVAAAAVVLLLVFVFKPNPPPVPAVNYQTVLGPAQIVKTYALHSVDASMPQAGGSAWVLERDGRNQIVVQLQGLTPTSGEGAYQVWLLRDGSRYNCGTLLTNGQGSGLLTYYITKENVSFDSIGVTLEPDAKGTQPRGPKVLGT